MARHDLYFDWLRERFAARKPDWRRKGWACLVDLHEGHAHILPANDIVNCHEVSEDCPCGPSMELLTDHPVDMPDVYMYTHQALDGRP